MSQSQIAPDAASRHHVQPQHPDLALAITTVSRSRVQECETARRIAAETGYPYLPRSNSALAQIAAQAGLDGLLVVERQGLALWINDQSLRYHPNMAKLRVLALEQQKNDVLIDALQLSPGDRVLDCTCGLGADAIVASYAVGPTGRVCALESSRPLALLVTRGMASFALADPPELVPAMRRVEVHHTDFATHLRAEADNTWDVVYFDPMFGETVAAAHGLDFVRHLAQPGGPAPADLTEARRVARRRVVMKDRLPGPELDRLGFATVQRGRRVCYGILDAL